MKTEIQTVHCSVVDLACPCPYDYRLDEVAGALSKLCRFTGQIPVHYSVAQHCINCARVASDEGYDRDIVRWALLHDATESLLGDVSSPLKSMLPGYKTLEERHMRVMADHFALPWPMPRIVKEIDRRMLVTERNEFFELVTRVWDGWDDCQPYDIPIVPMSSRWACENYISYANALGLA